MVGLRRLLYPNEGAVDGESDHNGVRESIGALLKIEGGSLLALTVAPLGYVTVEVDSNRSYTAGGGWGRHGRPLTCGVEAVLV